MGGFLKMVVQILNLDSVSAMSQDNIYKSRTDRLGEQ